MRTAPSPQGHPAAIKHEPPPSLPPADHGFTPRGSTERPVSLREVISRWLNEEL